MSLDSIGLNCITHFLLTTIMQTLFYIINRKTQLILIKDTAQESAVVLQSLDSNLIAIFYSKLMIHIHI